MGEEAKAGDSWDRGLDHFPVRSDLYIRLWPLRMTAFAVAPSNHSRVSNRDSLGGD